MPPAYAPPESIGFIGLGKMGEPMSRNLHKAGFKLALYDLNQSAVGRLAAEYGAETPATLAELGRQCRAGITIVPDGKAVRTIALGTPGGDSLVAGMARGSILIDMSSSAPPGTRELGQELAQRGIRLIDAPVSGGVKGAISQQLAVMIGGESADIEQCRAVLAAMGNKLFVAGALGAGHAIKCLNNFVSAAGYMAAAEALVAGKRFGLDPQVMLDVINASSGMNNSTQNKFSQQVLSRAFGSGFSIGLMAKDVRTALDLAHATGTPFPLGEHCEAVWTEAEKTLGAGADHTEIVRTLEQATGTQLGGAAK